MMPKRERNLRIYIIVTHKELAKELLSLQRRSVNNLS